MGIAAFLFADVIVPLLLFDDGGRVPIADHRLLRQDAVVVATRPVAIGDDGGDGMASPPTTSLRRAWNLPNGEVRFDLPLSFPGITTTEDGRRLRSASDDSSSSISLRDPIFLGSGGSGAVFSFDATTKDDDYPQHSAKEDRNRNDVAIKVSWRRSRDSVVNECDVLHRLEENDVPHVERCLGRPTPYPHEDGRVAIALTPVADSAATSTELKNVREGRPRRNGAKNVVETAVGMLRANVYTIDVQPLFYVETGDVLFVDFTEARGFGSLTITSSDEAALVGFCSEVWALIPDEMRGMAREFLSAELDGLREGGTPLPEKVVDILESFSID